MFAELRGHGFDDGVVLREDRGVAGFVGLVALGAGFRGAPVVGVDDDDGVADAEDAGVGGSPEVERLLVFAAAVAPRLEESWAGRGHELLDAAGREAAAGDGVAVVLGGGDVVDPSAGDLGHQSTSQPKLASYRS
ncbi:hypothetical protein ACFQV8_04760 [Pseudonocardia benzenivorans]